MSIGANIRKCRKERGYTQRELADMIGVSTQAISKWETDTGAPDISQIVPLASILEVTTDTLFGFGDLEKTDKYGRAKDSYHRLSVFRSRRYSEENHYEEAKPYFESHPQNTEAAAICLKNLVELIATDKVANRSHGELCAEIERYAGCIFKYENDADNYFLAHFMLARGYSALGENEKSAEILSRVPVTFGDRLYWEAEIAQADGDYDTAIAKCRKSFSMKARYVSRCIRMAGEVNEDRDEVLGLRKRVQYEEYMLRILNAFLSGGDYLPCRQIFQKYSLLCGMVFNYLRLGEYERSVDCAEMLFMGREEFIRFTKDPSGKSSLLFENNDSEEYQKETKESIDGYVTMSARHLRMIPEYEKYKRITALLERFGL